MRRAALALGLALVAGAAGACPAPSETLLFHSCWGEATAGLALLPEARPPAAPEGARRHLVITGAYTGRVPRAEDRPAPVGLFVDEGRVVNPNLARMDGILLLPPDGPPRLEHRRRLRFENETWDLADPARRAAFARRAAAAGIEVLQSHLVVIDGRSDVAPREDAPRARRRLFFSGPAGWGVWQSRAAITLHAAAKRIRTDLAPRMALNLDMGSHDYCVLTGSGAVRRCGVRGPGETDGLSNLLGLTLR